MNPNYLDESRAMAVEHGLSLALLTEDVLGDGTSRDENPLGLSGDGAIPVLLTSPRTTGLGQGRPGRASK